MGNIVAGASWAIGALFAAVALVELVAPRPVSDFYRDLGVPSWMRVAAGVVKAATAILLVVPGFRLAAAALGVTVCATSMTWFVLDLRFRLAGLTMATMLALVVVAAFER